MSHIITLLGSFILSILVLAISIKIYIKFPSTGKEFFWILFVGVGLVLLGVSFIIVHPMHPLTEPFSIDDLPCIIHMFISAMLLKAVYVAKEKFPV